MMEEDKHKEFPPQLKFLIHCVQSLNKQQYREALAIMGNGLIEALDAADELDGRELAAGFYMVVDTLDSTLKEAYGEDWEEIIDIPEIQAEEIEIRCSFCGKSQNEVTKIIAGPAVFICNECIAICNEILAEPASSDENRA